MMKAADLGDAADLGIRRGAALGDSSLRRISQLRMDSICVVVLDVLTEKTSKTVLVQDDRVVEQFSACAPDPPLGDAVLPRAPESGSPRLDAKILNRVGDPV